MKKFIMDLIFPIYCLGCHREKDFICPVCFNQIPLTIEPFIKIGDSNLKLIIVSNYDYPLLKKAIHHYKYDFIKDLSKPLSQLIIKKIADGNTIIKKPYNNFILIPVPLHIKRLKWRGFNQSELLAREISQKLDIPFNNEIITRLKHTSPQMQIKGAQKRKDNIANAFCVSHKLLNSLTPIIENKTVILIDDICTTGVTLEECAKALKPLNPKNIWALVLARG